MSTQPIEGNPLLDVAAAAAHLGVSETFVRRLVLERRVRYFKVGKFVRFRAVDLDAFVEAGRQEPGRHGYTYGQHSGAAHRMPGGNRQPRPGEKARPDDGERRRRPISDQMVADADGST